MMQPETEEQSNSNNAPTSYFCTIEPKLLEDPVCTAEGEVYDKQNIENWLKTNNTSFNTGAVLPHKNLTLNLFAKNRIDKFKQTGQVIPEIDECICPLTQILIDDPVLAPDGHTYERHALLTALARKK